MVFMRFNHKVKMSISTRLVFTLVGLGAFFFIPYSLYGKEKFPEKMINIMDYNRQTLSLVPTWINQESMETSCSRYGLPEIAIQHLDSYIGDEITYSDLIAYLSTFLNPQIQYLEIGVSVGKNLFQICNYLEKGIVVGLDLEKPNKSLENFFLNYQQLDSWESFTSVSVPYDHKRWFRKYGFTTDLLEKRCAGLYKYQTKNLYLRYSYPLRENDVYYLSGDIFDESIWEKLGNSAFKFNLIFSDAFHWGDAVLYEYEMLQKYHLLNEDSFVFVWDDLNEVHSGFDRIWNDLNKIYPRQLYRFVLRTRGWVGIHEKDFHYVGVIIKPRDKRSAASFLSQIHFLDIVRQDVPK